jgi:hypothetical protein
VIADDAGFVAPPGRLRPVIFTATIGLALEREMRDDFMTGLEAPGARHLAPA